MSDNTILENVKSDVEIILDEPVEEIIDSHELTPESLLRLFRSHNLSYSEACNMLQRTLNRLSLLIRQELQYLPLADKLVDNFDIDYVELSAIRSRQYTGNPPNFKVWISDYVRGSRNHYRKYSYRIFRTSDYEYGLQATEIGDTFKVAPELCKNHVVMLGRLADVATMHIKYTGKLPMNIKSSEGFSEDCPNYRAIRR